MKKTTWSLFALCFSFSAHSTSISQPSEVIVKYKEGQFRTLSSMNALYDSIEAVEIERISLADRELEVITLEEGVDVDSVVESLSTHPFVEYAQPNYKISLYPFEAKDGKKTSVDLFSFLGKPALEPVPTEPRTPVADPDLQSAYGITKIGSDQVWKTHKGSREMIVAVIDTGIDYNHEDLANNIWRNPNPTMGDVVGYDFVAKDGLPYDDLKVSGNGRTVYGHGTHCAGTIGATGGNGIGVSGVNQKVSIMGLKFLDAQGRGDTALAVQAIDYAISHGAKVLSNSWGSMGFPLLAKMQNKALYEAIDRSEKAGTLFVAAAGNGNPATGTSMNNDSWLLSNYPSSFEQENIIAVAATDSNDKLGSFSNYGKKSVDLSAPGVNVYSLAPVTKYATYSGTSMATPHVAGAAALLWSKAPHLSAKQIKKLLMDHVDSVDALKDKTVSGGRLNVAKAFQAL